eukprot:254048-Hanusia_phi.AAC.1
MFHLINNLGVDRLIIVPDTEGIANCSPSSAVREGRVHQELGKGRSWKSGGSSQRLSLDLIKYTYTQSVRIESCPLRV